MKLLIKLIIMFSVVIAIITGAIGIFSVISMTSQVTHLAEKKLLANEAMAKALLDEKFPGDWDIRENQLYKGNTLMENNHEVVDSIGALTGDHIILLKGETSVAASVNSSGQRDIEFILENKIKEAVLKNGENYIGITHDGKELTLYEPLKNKQGSVIGAFHVGMAKEMYNHASTSFREGIIWFAIFGFVVSITASAYLSIRFVLPIIKITRLVEQVAVGDLRAETISINSKDELSKLANEVFRMVHGLRHIVQTIHNLTHKVRQSSGSVSEKTIHIGTMAKEVEATVQEVAIGASHQTHGTAESAKAIEAISNRIQYIAGISASVADVSSDSAAKAEQGNIAIQTALEEVRLLNSTTHHLAEKVHELNRNSVNVEQIAAVITEIAAQTNLIALNAAIEAARAGEQGRGFTIVAGEVRKLAEQSDRSAQEIRSIISTIQYTSKDISESMKIELEQLERCMGVMNESGQVFGHIVEAARFVAEQNQEVASSTQEIVAGTEEITASIHEVSFISSKTMDNVASISEASRTQSDSMKEITEVVESMLHSVDEMERAVTVFRL